MKIFLDANVLFTAAYSNGGKANFLIKHAKTLNLSLYTSDYALDEASRNLFKKKLEAIGEFELLIQNIMTLTSVIGPCPISLPVKDVPIFLTALKNNMTHLLTGDKKDFGPFMNDTKKACGVLIQTVTDFLNSLE